MNRPVNGVSEKIAALTAFNRKRAVLTALNWKKSGVNAFRPEKWRYEHRLTGRIADLTVLNRENGGVDGV